MIGGCPTPCDELRELLGGYVLGALEPAERTELERHLERCPRCRAELDALRPLPSLLDLAAPGTPEPPPRLEALVLDRLAAERGARRRRRRPRVRRRATLVAVAAACAVAAATAVAVVVVDDGGSWAEGRYVVELDGGSRAQGQAALREVEAGMSLRLRAWGLPAGATLELQCLRGDGTPVSGGTFETDARGRASAELTAAVRRGDYSAIRVVRRGSDGPAVLSVRLD